MEEVDPHVEAAVLWLAQTILQVLFAGKMEEWIRQVGLVDDTERLKSEIERVEAVVTAVKGRAAENRPLARSLGRVKELLYDADDMVDELDYYRLQRQVEGGTIAWANQPQGTDINGAAQLVDGSRDHSGIPNRNERKKRSKAWEGFSIIKVDTDGKPLEAKCIYCHTVVRCETTKGTSVLHNHLKSDNCKRKRAAIQPNPSSAADGAQNGATVAVDCSDSRKRMRIDEESAHNTAASTHPWDKAEFCNRIQQKIHQLQKATSEVQKLYGSGSVTSLNLCRNTATDPCRRTSSLVQRKMYGRVAEKNSILQLMAEGTSDGVLILPIVGIGGIGKTALAQLVYNDPIVKNQFDHRMWVWVSSNFDEVRLTLEMLDFVSHEKYVGISSLAKLQEILAIHVTSQRTLLILDDVWEDIDDCQWNKLLPPLRSHNAKGNAILVTTRKLSIAKRIGTVEPIKLGSLHADDFWPLFKTCSFGDENYKEHLSLNIIGRQIAEKLQGNPLAAETAGMLLREYLTIDHWSSILKSEKWKSLDLCGGIMHALKLSYDELPYYLQQCFLYCSIFPPSHQFVSKELICIWISQGFVNCGHSTVRLEEIGRNHLTNLVNSGFFEQVETQNTTPGDQTCYVISSLMYDFARQVSRTFCTTINGVESTKVQPSVRHLSIVTDAAYHKDHHGNILPNVKFEEKMRSITTQIVKLRTLVLIGEFDSLFFGFFKYIFQKARRLRLLQISSRNADYASLSCDSISPTHLRYLKLVDNDGDGALSHSLSKFYHLQVLDVGKLQGPGTHYNMNCLVSLRHLNIPKGVYSSISGIGKMTSLQELHDFSIDGSSGSKITELQFMNELLQLGVSRLENIGTRDEACGAKLSDKGHLEKLHLSWKDLPQDEYASDMWSQSEDESLPESNGNQISEYFANSARAVLEGLEPQHNLKHIQISGYSGPTSPAWLGTSVTHLQTLHLEDCGEWKILPSLGRLPFLTKLELRNMRSVIEVSLPSLEELVLMKMPKLERCFCNSISELNSRITVLKIGRCRVLKAFPLFESCEKLKIEHKSWLPRLNKLNMYRCPCLTVSNPLPPSSKVCELHIVGVSTLPIMKRSTDGELIIGDLREDSDNLMELDSKNLSFHNLRALTQLQIKCCWNLSSISLEGFRQLISLKSLEISYCKKLFSSDVLPEHGREYMANTNFNALPSLKHLRIEDCGITGKWLSMILQHAPALEEMNLGSCHQLSVLVIEVKESSLSNYTSTPLASSPGNADDVLTCSTTEGHLRIPSKLIPSLKKIIIARCNELTFQGNKAAFSVFASLEELTIERCPKLILSLLYKYENGDQGNGIWLLPCSLRELEVVGLAVELYDSLETLQPCFLEDRNCLKRLRIGGSLRLKSLDLRSCTALEELIVDYCESLAALEGNFTRLKKLVLDENSGLESLPLYSCTALEGLTIRSCTSLAALEGNFTCLKELVLEDNSGLESLPLYSCTALEGLTIGSCTSLAALEGNFTCLRKLELWHNPRLKSVQLRFCAALEDLEIHDCESLDVLEDFQSLRGLRYLDVFRCPSLTPYLERLFSQGYELCAGLVRLCTDDFSFLATSFCKSLTSLQRLELRGRTGGVARLTDEQERALEFLTSLRDLRFLFCDNLTDLPVSLQSLPSLKKLEIVYSPLISGLPEKGLPPSLEELDIIYLLNDCSKTLIEMLIEQCRTLATSKLKVKINGNYLK